jgi:5-methylcytosine-specific restriction endonuclease McrA
MYISDRSKDSKFIKWSADVKTKDNYQCQICGQHGVDLNSHHKNSWDIYPELRYDLDNGAALCVVCHKRFHDSYGFGKNTEFQYMEFKLISQLFTENILKKTAK